MSAVREARRRSSAGLRNVPVPAIVARHPTYEGTQKMQRREGTTGLWHLAWDYLCRMVYQSPEVSARPDKCATPHNISDRQAGNPSTSTSQPYDSMPRRRAQHGRGATEYAEPVQCVRGVLPAFPKVRQAGFEAWGQLCGFTNFRFIEVRLDSNPVPLASACILPTSLRSMSSLNAVWRGLQARGTCFGEFWSSFDRDQISS